MVYTGIGARALPEEWYPTIRQYAMGFAKRGYILRSGGAPGADSVWEEGSDLGGGQKEIYLPWPGFEGRKSQWTRPTQAALDMAAERCPSCVSRRGFHALQARNCHQVLGYDLANPIPSDLLLAWTMRPETDRSGSMFAIHLARDYGVPVFNLAIEGEAARLVAWVRERS